jgi:hypothetical protein
MSLYFVLNQFNAVNKLTPCHLRLISSLLCSDSLTKCAAAIQERVTAVLRSITKEAFADSFQKLYERCQQCVVKDGDYFEGQ